MMKYAEFVQRTHFNQAELIAFAHGTLVDDPPEDFAQLPSPPFLMFDRVTEVVRDRPGRITAEQDIRLDGWYFQCHFRGDPVQPGCLGVDAVWQLLGFYMTVNGSPGRGRALGCKSVEFSGQIRPYNQLVRYDVRVKRYTRLKESGVSLIIGDATVLVDGEAIYEVEAAKVGCFLGIGYTDFPRRSANAVGGIFKR